ncbi:NACHT domain-containing protein [Geitlerinema sp. P-1104]|uniref:GUN4 domain-containing protein n=1 Tax=Geitlerinema sp. P-1104 TaxID=2546230 RepID=UPI00147734A0|nr:GUN4 domain-containing protein [Geitlerinema sp. P-1104]NMG60369.1 NACHT domain-containing protein [Geitlerinema sp. P-1104]
MAQLPKPVQFLIQWFPSGLFGGLAVHSAAAGNIRDALISTLIAAGGSVWASSTKVFMERINAGLNERLICTADKLLIATDTLLGKLRWQLSGFRGKYYNSLIESHYALKTEGFSNMLPVLDLEEVFVPLQVAQPPREVPGGVVTRQPVPPLGNGETPQLWDFLRESRQTRSFRRIAILAPPGFGKTTLLQHITLTYAQKKQSKHKAPKRFPVLIRMRDVRKSLVQSQPPSLPELIRERVQQLRLYKTLEPPEGYFEKLLQEGQCLVMLDGLDEVADVAERQRVSDWVNKQMRQYPQANFVLSSRPHGFEGERLDKVGIVLEVQPFNLEQIRQFVQSWYRQMKIRQRGGRDTPAVRADAEEKAKHLIQALLLNPPMRRLAGNPLLVTMIATVDALGNASPKRRVELLGNALPKRRVELYREICDVLLGRRLDAKQLTLPLTAGQNQNILQVLALALMQKGKTTFELQAVEPLIQEQLEKNNAQTLTPAQWLKGIQDNVGLLVEKTIGIYEFAHLSFQEYLSAVQVKNLKQEQLLVDHFEDPFWAETIRLYAAQSNSNASTLIQYAIHHRTVQTLSLAYDCLEEAPEVTREVRQDLEDILEAGLCSDNPQVAAMAATVKLSRRLNRLLEDDARLAIDLSYLSQAEYQFLIHQGNDSENKFRLEMTSAEAQQRATPLEYDMVLQALTRLNQQKLPSEQQEDGCFYYYRLPTGEELNRYPVNDNQDLGCWTEKDFDRGPQSKGIRIVQEKILKNYETLANYLAAGAWKEADEETRAVMLKVAKREGDHRLDTKSIETFSSEDLRVIDRLWVYHSSGRFGFSVQKRIYEKVGKDFQQFYKCVEWNSVRYIVSAPAGHFPLWMVIKTEENKLHMFGVQELRRQDPRIEVSGIISPVASWLSLSLLSRTDL